MDNKSREFRDVKEKSERIISQYREKVRSAVKAASEAAFADWATETQRLVESAFRKAISDFYDDYTPGRYRRAGDPIEGTGGLYNLLEISRNSKSMTIWYNEDGIGVSDAGGWEDEDALAGVLYKNVFENGAHGGRTRGVGHPSPGTPYWRTGRHFSSWGSPAKIAHVSPRSAFEESVGVINSAAQDRYDSFFGKYLGKELSS